MYQDVDIKRKAQMNKEVKIIGAGLAGAEAAWQLAQRKIPVKLYEMRPKKMTDAHHSGYFGELVCSNSLRSNQLDNAAGLLKEELRQVGSLLISVADEVAVSAGGALAVDREAFAKKVTDLLIKEPLIEIRHEEMTKLDASDLIIIASGPLTSQKLFDEIKKLTGEDTLYFYDAAAPIVTTESIDMEHTFWQSRYDKGSGFDYLNCPLSREEYDFFYKELIHSKWVETKDFEKEIFFEGCMPIETMASRGKETLLYGPMKPVGLVNPKDQKIPYAVVQLRRDNLSGSLMNIVGFQTRMLWNEQRRVLGCIPALKNAEIVRYGVMHRNTFINAPRLLNEFNQLKSNKNIFFAGQITGVEGYIESIASGYLSALYMRKYIDNDNLMAVPSEVAMGSLMNYLVQSNPDSFQPMNINFGLMPKLEIKIKNKKERNLLYAKRALGMLKKYQEYYING